MKEANQILLDLKRKIYKPVYFLSGEEPYYIDQISDYIENNVLDEGEREFNQTIVYGKDSDLNSIIGLAKQYPMMSEHTVVIVKEAQNLKELNKSAGGEEESGESKTSSKSGAAPAQALLNFLTQPPSTSILVFCYKYKTIDKRSAVAKTLQKQAVFLETKKLYDNQLPEWITAHIKDRGYTINPRTAFMMAEYLGNDLSKVVNETGKLVIGLEQGKEITAEHVHEKIGISKEYNVFELCDAFTNKDILKANRIINYFAANEKENPLVLVLGNLYSHFNKILKYHYVPDKNKFAAASALGVNPFFVEGYAKAAQIYPTGRLKDVFSALHECDLRSKGINNSSLDHGELLKELVYRIMH